MKDERTISSRGPVAPEIQTYGIAGILQIIKEMEKSGESERKISGNVFGPFFSWADYRCVIRTGVGGNGPRRSASRKPV